MVGELDLSLSINYSSKILISCTSIYEFIYFIIFLLYRDSIFFQYLILYKITPFSV